MLRKLLCNLPLAISFLRFKLNFYWVKSGGIYVAFHLLLVSDCIIWLRKCLLDYVRVECLFSSVIHNWAVGLMPQSAGFSSLPAEGKQSDKDIFHLLIYSPNAIVRDKPAGPRWCQQPKIQSRACAGMAGIQTLSHHPLCPRAHIRRKLKWRARLVSGPGS